LRSEGQSGIQVHILRYRKFLILYYTEELHQLFAYRIFRETYDKEPGMSAESNTSDVFALLLTL